MSLVLPSREARPLKPGIYKTDLFNCSPLFSVNMGGNNSNKTYFVKSWEEAFSLHGEATPADINPRYIAALISEDRNAEISPYLRINRITRSCYLKLMLDGSYVTKQFDSLSGGLPSVSSKELNEYLRLRLTNIIENLIKNESSKIGLEHSSGLDSNALLGCMINGLNIKKEKIITWSREDHGEGDNLDFIRNYYDLIPSNIFKYHPENYDPSKFRSNIHTLISLLGAPPRNKFSFQEEKIFSESGCGIHLSGFGGDQCLSNKAKNVPTDLVLNGKWLELVDLTGSHLMAVRIIFSRLFGHYFRPYATYNVLKQQSEYVKINPLIDHLSIKGKETFTPYLEPKYPWSQDRYITHNTFLRKNLTSHYLALRVEEETRLSRCFGLEKYFPLLDNFMISSVLNQDPIYSGDGLNNGRMIHLNAFEPFLTSIHIQRKINHDKQTLISWYDKMKNSLLYHLSQLDQLHPSIYGFWNISSLKSEIESALNNPDILLEHLVKYNRGLLILQNINCWFIELD